MGSDGLPSESKVYAKFMNNLVIEQEASSEFIRIGFNHQSPEIAANWTTLVIKELNNFIRKQDISEAESSIAYLKQQIEISPLTDLRKLFYNLIQSQTETMMLANVREEYVFKTIDPATVPEFKSEPNKALIFIIGTLLGVIISLVFVLSNHFFVHAKFKN